MTLPHVWPSRGSVTMLAYGNHTSEAHVWSL